MKQKIDVEFYTNWVAKFRNESSNSGFYIYSYVNAQSETELNKEIKKYLSEDFNMYLHKKLKEERIIFKWKKKNWDIIIESLEY